MPNFLQQKGDSNTSNGFEFEFPRFGGLPGSHLFDNGVVAKDSNKNSPQARSSSTLNGSSTNGILSRHDSANRSLSPKSQTQGNGTASQSPPASNGFSTNKLQPKAQTNGVEDLARLFSPSILKTGNPFDQGFSKINENTNKENSVGENSIGQTNRVFRFNSTPSNTASPSDSSASQYNANSSCGTSPEPSHNSPDNVKIDEMVTGDATTGGYVCHGNSEGEVAFCEKLNMACGNPRNPIPRAKSMSNGTPALPNPSSLNSLAVSKGNAPASTKSPAAELSGIDWLANQNGGQFDPTLFGDYRESQDAIVGGGDFTGGFFSDAFSLPDFGSPALFGQEGNQNTLMSEIEKTQNGADEEEVVPGEDPNQMLSCNKIWYALSPPRSTPLFLLTQLSRNQLQDRPDFQEGSFDIEGLCSELRAKARCSETGVVVDQKDVDAALKKIPQPI